MVILVALVLASVSVPAARAETRLQFGPLVSIQPAGYGNALPYLDNGIGGAQPGLALSIERGTARGWLFGLELSSTRSLSATQRGRLVFREAGGPCGRVPSDGCGPVESRHRDSLVSALFGKRFVDGRGGVEFKLGPSLILGTPKQGSFTIEEAAGHFALTAAVDLALPVSDRLELVPSLRYSRAFRGERDFYVGLGANIFRVGVGLRVRLSPN